MRKLTISGAFLAALGLLLLATAGEARAAPFGGARLRSAAGLVVGFGCGCRPVRRRVVVVRRVYVRPSPCRTTCRTYGYRTYAYPYYGYRTYAYPYYGYRTYGYPTYRYRTYGYPAYRYPAVGFGFGYGFGHHRRYRAYRGPRRVIGRRR
jgi:hypothetical protein